MLHALPSILRYIWLDWEDVWWYLAWYKTSYAVLQFRKFRILLTFLSFSISRWLTISPDGITMMNKTWQGNVMGFQKLKQIIMFLFYLNVEINVISVSLCLIDWFYFILFFLLQMSTNFDFSIIFYINVVHIFIIRWLKHYTSRNNFINLLKQ